MKAQMTLGIVFGLTIAVQAVTGWAESAVRSAKHEDYAKELWGFLQAAKYQQWPAVTPEADFAVGPPSARSAKHFSRQTSETARQASGAVIVTEHFVGEPPALTAVTVRLKREPGYNPRHDDWYWVHYTPDGRAVETAADKNPWAKRGFAVMEEDGRLWVFDANCPELSKYLQDGELAKHVVLPGAGPGGTTLKGPDAGTLDRYVVAKPGFATRLEDGRAWVFRDGAAELSQFETHGELAKHVVRPGVGPRGMTLKAPDAETLDEYLVAQPGFVTKIDDGRVWVFRQGAPEWNEFQEKGELAKHVIRPGAGPGGMTVRAPDAETLDGYLNACGP